MTRRHDDRSIASDRCELNLSGSRHECRLKNISATGALVSCVGFLRETWPGDMCELHLHNESDAIVCQVTHIEASLVGLKFVDKHDQ